MGMHVGKFVRRAALVGSATLFSTCAPSSISAPPPMRPVPEGPALAGRSVGLLDLGHVAPTSVVGVAGIRYTTSRIAL